MDIWIWTDEYVLRDRLELDYPGAATDNHLNSFAMDTFQNGFLFESKRGRLCLPASRIRSVTDYAPPGCDIPVYVSKSCTDEIARLHKERNPPEVDPE